MNNSKPSITPALIIQLILVVVIIPFLPLLISQQWDWWEAWLFALLNIVSFVVSRVLAGRRHPDIIAERSRFMKQPNTKSFDKAMAPLLLLGGLTTLVVIGLDERLGWSPAFSLGVKLAALFCIVAGYTWSSYALIKNRFFSGTVRIQSERGHSVVSSGPYRWMRHPGYAGGMLAYLATPFFLYSWWALIPTLLLCIVMVIRTSLEDRTLKAELDGYKEYAQRVRYRLLPGVW